MKYKLIVCGRKIVNVEISSKCKSVLHNGRPTVKTVAYLFKHLKSQLCTSCHEHMTGLLELDNHSCIPQLLNINHMRYLTRRIDSDPFDNRRSYTSRNHTLGLVVAESMLRTTTARQHAIGISSTSHLSSLPEDSCAHP